MHPSSWEMGGAEAKEEQQDSSAGSPDLWLMDLERKGRQLEEDGEKKNNRASLITEGNKLKSKDGFYPEEEQWDASGLGHGPGLGLGLMLGASNSSDLFGTPSTLSSSGTLTATSFRIKPEFSIFSGGSDEEQPGFGEELGPDGGAGPACFEETSEEERAAGASCASNQSGFWLMSWCMLQMDT